MSPLVDKLVGFGVPLTVIGTALGLSIAFDLWGERTPPPPASVAAVIARNCPDGIAARTAIGEGYLLLTDADDRFCGIVRE